MGYNIIKKLFWWRKKEKPLPSKPESDYLVSVTVRGEKDGALDIKCEWQEESEISIAMLAEILFYLDSGFIGPYIQNILIKHVSDNPEAEDFIMETFQLLHEMSQTMSDRPLIKPSNVFGSEGEIGP